MMQAMLVWWWLLDGNRGSIGEAVVIMSLVAMAHICVSSNAVGGMVMTGGSAPGKGALPMRAIIVPVTGWVPWWNPMEG